MNVALILAKKGSIGAPGKNLYVWRGAPLLNHTIDAASDTGVFDHVFVSTNCEQTAGFARKSNAHVIIRDDAFADNSRYVDSVNHAVHQIQKQIGQIKTITIPMTVQPIREPGVFSRILSLHGEDVDSVVTVKRFDASIAWIFNRKKSGKLAHHESIRYGSDIARRDDLFIIDNAITSFTYESWRKSEGITAWPYLGSRIIGIEQETGNANYNADVNTMDDLEWLEFVSTYPEWKKNRESS